MPHALIIDDDTSVRTVLRGVLRDRGWAVSETDDGAAVEDLLAAERYELLVLDLYMPGMNGFEVIRRVRQRYGGLAPRWKTPATVGIIVVSGAAGTDGLRFATSLGADVCLKKPFDIDDVAAAVRSLRR